MKITVYVVFAVVCCCLHFGEAIPRSRRSRLADLDEVQNQEILSRNRRQNKLPAVFNEETTTTTSTAKPEELQSKPKQRRRQNKALSLFGFYPTFFSSDADYSEDDDDINFTVNDDNVPDEDLSRTIPSRPTQIKKKHNTKNRYPVDAVNSLQYDNSPIFYIRLPPTPYMYVPGLGYVSQPPQLGPPMAPVPPPNPFINVPIDFVSNGKPTNVYQWAGNPAFGPPQPQLNPYNPYDVSQPLLPPGNNYNGYSKPQVIKKSPSDSKVTNLKGPFVFNGKPNDKVFVLRDSYNSLYSDALQNFYP